MVQTEKWFKQFKRFKRRKWFELKKNGLNRKKNGSNHFSLNHPSPLIGEVKAGNRRRFWRRFWHRFWSDSRNRIVQESIQLWPTPILLSTLHRFCLDLRSVLCAQISL
jgi:hypothetical protein